MHASYSLTPCFTLSVCLRMKRSFGHASHPSPFCFTLSVCPRVRSFGHASHPSPFCFTLSVCLRVWPHLPPFCFTLFWTHLQPLPLLFYLVCMSESLAIPPTPFPFALLCFGHTSNPSPFCFTLSVCLRVRRSLGHAMSHTRTVQSALALARTFRMILFQDNPNTASVCPSMEVGVALD